MRTTGKGLYKWVKEQKGVVWPKQFGGLLFYFTYNDVKCAGIVTKLYSGTKLIETGLQIRPMQIKHDIGAGAGMSVFKTFKQDANKKPIANIKKK